MPVGRPRAGVAELVDALRSGRSELYAHMGSTPISGNDGIRVLRA